METYEQQYGVIYTRVGQRTVNERNGQFSMTLPKKIMEDRGFRNHDSVEIFINKANGDVLLRKVQNFEKGE